MFNNGPGSLDDALVTFVEHDHHIGCFAGAVIPVGFDCVIEPQDGWCGASTEDTSTRVESFCERSEPIRCLSFSCGDWVTAQRHSSDDSEGSLRSDEDLVQIWSHCLPWLTASRNDSPIGEYDLQTCHDIFDLAVSG